MGGFWSRVWVLFWTLRQILEGTINAMGLGHLPQLASRKRKSACDIEPVYSALILILTATLPFQRSTLRLSSAFKRSRRHSGPFERNSYHKDHTLGQQFLGILVQSVRLNEACLTDELRQAPPLSPAHATLALPLTFFLQRTTPPMVFLLDARWTPLMDCLLDSSNSMKTVQKPLLGVTVTVLP
ncbi:hypothetical protein NDU88_005264 [Pleurodeles waltl]|uniref:Uncharacterized protein n=1 Tax=Pleurodeles waltl TaxID=8319 RepID=A0AAV7TAS2_PLEWA|nr:hypothetical protein NDU88_005264 [Pleurodeles waltl]